MLYLLFVLTFLAGILFYGLSPSDKRLEMTAHQAEGMIVSFLAQHQAAKDYLYTWLGVGPCFDDDRDSNLKTCSRLQPAFIEMMPKSVANDMCDGNEGTPGKTGFQTCKYGDDTNFPGFISRIVCTTADGAGSSGCTEAGAKHYVITYGGWECEKSNAGNCIPNSYTRPSWWPRLGQKMRRFESWRKAIANRTRGSVSCGTLVKVEDGKWCIDNGETVYKNEKTMSTCMNQIPAAVITELGDDYATDEGKEDLLFCLSEFRQGLPGYYVQTPAYFYDALSNSGVGIHKNRNELDWVNLLNTTQTFTAKFSNGNLHASLVPESPVLDTSIPLTGNYTITILAKVNPETGTLSLFTGQKDGSDEAIFWWQKDSACPGFNNAFVFKHATEGKYDADCFSTTHTGIISWTFVVGNCPEDSGYSTTETCMSVYENAVRRIIRKKETFDGTLKIGTTGANPGANIYGVRYYNSALTPKEIQQNFKVDQKRFGLSDANNGGTVETRSNEEAKYDQK